jgi:hypothetical protein
MPSGTRASFRAGGRGVAEAACPLRARDAEGQTAPDRGSCITLCQESDPTDPEVIELCERIIEAQQEEMTQMEAILDRYASGG